MSDEPLDASTIFGPTAPARASTQLDHAADEIASMFGAEPDDAPIDEMKRTLPAPPLRAGPEGGQGGAEGEGRRRGMPTPELRERPAQGAAEVFTQRGIRMLLGKIERLERDLAEAVQRIMAVDNHLATTYRAVRVLAKKFAESSATTERRDEDAVSGDEVVRSINDRLSTLEDRVSASLSRAEGSREALARLDRTIGSLREELSSRLGAGRSEDVSRETADS